MKTSCGKFLNLAHYFPYDVKARNAIVGAESLLKRHILWFPSAFSVVFFSVDDRRKRNKKYAFSNEDELAWTGENNRQTLVWSKIFCFVVVEMKTNTF